MSSIVEEHADAGDSQIEPSESEVNEVNEPCGQENRGNKEIVVVNSTESSSESEDHEGMEDRFRGDSIASIPEITLPEYIRQSGETSSSSPSFFKNLGFMSCRKFVLKFMFSA